MTDSATVFRVSAWVLLVVAVLLWSSHHLGLGPGNLGWLAGVGAALTAALSSLDKLLEKNQIDVIKKQLQPMLAMVFSPPVLLVLYAAATITAATVSSVRVAQGESVVEKGLTLTLAPVDGGSADKELELKQPQQSLDRALVVTSPLGRAFRLSAPGFVTQSFEVYPIVGHSLTLGDDIKRAPSVLLRLPPAGELALGSEGKLQVTRLDSGEVIATSSAAGAAFLIGRVQPIPAGAQLRWSSELQDANLGPEENRRLLKAWRKPEAIVSSATLLPGMSLRAEVISPSNWVAAKAEFTLGDESFVDQLLEEMPTE